MVHLVSLGKDKTSRERESRDDACQLAWPADQSATTRRKSAVFSQTAPSQLGASFTTSTLFIMARSALAKEQFVKLIVGAGQASPSPPVGPALGSKGVKSMDFCKVSFPLLSPLKPCRNRDY